MTLFRGGTVLLACTAGTAIANNYAVQPALGGRPTPCGRHEPHGSGSRLARIPVAEGHVRL